MAKEADKTLFTAPINNLRQIRRLKEQIKSQKKIYALTGLIASARALFLYAFSLNKKKRLVICPDEQSAKNLYEQYRTFDRNCRFFPIKDLLFYESDLRSNELTIERMQVIKDLESGEDVTVFAPISALLNRLAPTQTFTSKNIHITNKDKIDITTLRDKLFFLGYERVPMVSVPGEFSLRGGIIDIFVLTHNQPIRIEMWDDEVDSIRVFDSDSQKSLEYIDEFTIFPASEILLSKEEIQNGLKKIEESFENAIESLRKSGDERAVRQLYEKIKYSVLAEDSDISDSDIEPYLNFFYDEISLLTDFFQEEGCIFIDDLPACRDNANEYYEEFLDGMNGRVKTGFALGEQIELLASPEDLFSRIRDITTILFEGVIEGNDTLPIDERIDINTLQGINYNSSIPLLKKELTGFISKGYGVVICGNSRARQKRLADTLLEDGYNCFYTDDLTQRPIPKNIMLVVTALSKSVELPEAKVIYISENDVFGGNHKRRQRKTFKKGQEIESFRQLAVGDYVVHEGYGLGIYEGIEKITVAGVQKDYLKISYRGEDNLYVPIDQLTMITKYSGAGEQKIRLNSLSGGDWSKTKSSVKQAVDDLAEELINLYALRNKERGFSYTRDTAWQQEFEEGFPYEETPSQREAIMRVKEDLESEKIMDRLICGDVGFGKTEIALRAAFKVVQESKQVAFLVPTTVLAKQHYNTFCERMSGFPIRIGMLSRFRSDSQNKKTVQALKQGELDIVIGTHRALSKDVEFKDLGLLVIDEEQRFGVRHKEKIKMLKNNVDVLCLSATPIPRTLHMSLVGIRDMSLLDEAPLERLPIQTFVFEQNNELIREAIKREIKRGGQVFYVVNRIRDIREIADNISGLIPEAKVVYAHGRMDENELEDIMSDFIEGDIDVLVATTIIELGLDISNVNTIIIHDADNFGLSQLYQLRGRVGRGSRTAYAFLMYRPGKAIKDVARKRLMAIKEFSALGSGFKISMRDLELRGAGDVIGARQHGHVDAVGYELYCKYLSSAIEMKKNDTPQVLEYETSIDIITDSFISENYIPDEAQRLEIYKRIAGTENEQGRLDIIDELIDRFGQPPISVINLIDISLLRHRLHECYVLKVKETEEGYRIDLYPRARLRGEKIPEFMALYDDRIYFEKDPKKPSFFIKNKKGKPREDTISRLREIADNMYNILLSVDLENDS